MTPQFATAGVTALPVNTETPVIPSKQVPTGSYVVNAKVNLQAINGVAAIVECTLFSGLTAVDTAQWTSTIGTRTVVPLQGVTTASPGNPLRITCNPDDTGGNASNVKLTAIPVG